MATPDWDHEVEGGTEGSTLRPSILILEGLSGCRACILRAGGLPIEVDPWDSEEVARLFELKVIHGMLLTGGGDVDPRLYHRKPHPKVYGVSELRDWSEQSALTLAEQAGIPVMGICRGAQIINVWAGGTLWQHIGGHYGTFPIAPLDNTRLYKTLGGEAHTVKHLHHQAIKRVAPGFRVAAVSRDRHVEAIESTDGRVLGVQFHPEILTHAQHARRLFRWLVCEAANRAGLPEPSERSYISTWSSVSPARAVVLWNTEWGNDPTVKCPVCDMTFYTTAGREAHLIHYHEWSRIDLETWTAQGGLDCEVPGCNRVFSTDEEYNRHMEEDHGGAATCEGCTRQVDTGLHHLATGWELCTECIRALVGG